LVLEPIFEADLQPEQYAYRRDRSALDAVKHVHKLINTGYGEIVDAADWSAVFEKSHSAGQLHAASGAVPGQNQRPQDLHSAVGTTLSAISWFRRIPPIR
jgi:hypothetical protein